MTRTENILEEYRNGDLEKRLNLFMECPPLRSRFLEIDQRETAALASSSPHRKHHLRQAPSATSGVSVSWPRDSNSPNIRGRRLAR